MECTGKIQNITKDLYNGKLNITFQIDSYSVDEINEFNQTSDVLDIVVKKHRQKRSLDANAYCWVLCSKIAEKVHSSKDEVYEEMLQKYGYFYQDEEGYISITVKAEVDMSKIAGHWKFLKTNGKFTSYLMIKGSSEYDTRQMARFIDCIVEEAKILGIETMTPTELERMKAAWQKA